MGGDEKLIYVYVLICNTNTRNDTCVGGCLCMHACMHASLHPSAPTLADDEGAGIGPHAVDIRQDKGEEGGRGLL